MRLRRPPTAKQKRWLQSARFKAVAALGRAKGMLVFKRLPRCGAKRKNGETCKAIALENGRCRYHGGKTGRGKAWHVHRFDRTNDPAKVDRKLRDIERKRRERDVRLATMTPDQRARYEAWRATHKPGVPVGRAMARAATSAKADLAALFEQDRREEEAKAHQLAEARRRVASSAPSTRPTCGHDNPLSKPSIFD